MASWIFHGILMDCHENKTWSMLWFQNKYNWQCLKMHLRFLQNSFFLNIMKYSKLLWIKVPHIHVNTNFLIIFQVFCNTWIVCGLYEQFSNVRWFTLTVWYSQKKCSRYCKLDLLFFFAFCFLHFVKTTVEYGSMTAINFRLTQKMEDGECLEIVIISNGVEIKHIWHIL